MASDLLTGFGIFDRFTDEQRQHVIDIASEVSYPAGTRLFTDGEDAIGCWLIRTGTVAIETAVPGRGQVVVQTLGSGDLLGWSWLVAPHRWHFTATTVEPVTALLLDTERLRALADRDPELGYRLARGMFEVLLERLQSTRARLLDLYGSPRDR